MAYIPTGKELIDPFKVLEEADTRAGMKVADFGCGTIGHYVFPASRLVGPEGRVYAVDILKSVLGGIQSRVKMETANNVETIWGDLERPKGVSIPDGELDIGLLINNLFMSRHREAMMSECVRTVRPGGKFVVIDWKPNGPAFGPDQSTRVSADEARKLAEAAGLVFLKAFEPGRFHYGLVFTKP